MADGDLASRLRPLWEDAASRAEPLPPEGELAERLGVSTGAVREALVRLESEGLVRRRQGAGTFPNTLALDMPARLDQETDFADMLRAAGHEPLVEVLEAGWITLDEEQAAALDAAIGAPAFRTVKRWRANNVAVMVAQDVIPARAVREVDDPSAPVLHLTNAIGVGRCEWICTWPGAANVDAGMSALIERPAGEALLTLRHIGVGRHGIRCFLADEHHVPGLLRYGLILNVT